MTKRRERNGMKLEGEAGLRSIHSTLYIKEITCRQLEENRW